MLESLSIENFAIIDKLEVEFGAGLNVITGETGAGKTIIAQALNLILGDRTSTDLIRSGESKAKVTAVFSLKEAGEDFLKHLSDLDLDDSKELIIHRLVSADGKSKATINGTQVTRQNLKEIAERLVDISSQHEHQLLLKPATHIEVIDQFGDLKSLVNNYAKIHQEFVRISDELGSLRTRERETKERLDFTKYQWQELKNAKLQAEEDEELETEKMKIKHAVQLESKMREAERLLYESSGSAVELVGQVCETLASCAQIDSKITLWRDITSRVSSELADVAREVKHYAERLDSNPARLEEIEERIHLIKGLKRKHGGTIESCIEKLSALEKEIEEVENWDDVLKQKETALNEVRKERLQSAKDLTSKRKVVAQRLEKSTEEEASSLGFKKLKFTVQMESLPEEKWDLRGAEQIEFLITPNVGEKPRVLVKIASGGELSRIMLAIKRVLAKQAGIVLTSIFDEVDSGIGGAVAEIVGRKLKEVAHNRQVICITHLPQIASFGEHHFAVEKKVVDGRTIVDVESKKGVARTEELARMLGGTKITDTTRAHAREMLRNAAGNNGKSEARNPKSETNSNHQNPNDRNRSFGF